MDERVFQVEGPTTVRIQDLAGDLEVVGWSEGQISIVADEDEMPDAQWHAGVLMLNGGDDLQLRLPADSQVIVERAGGDVSMTGMGQVQLQWVGGDAEIHNVGELTIGNISADLSIRNTGNVNGGVVQGDFEAHRIGNLTLARVSGDAEIHQVGNLNLTAVMGDLTVHEAGNVNATQVYGDASLHMLSGNLSIEVVRGDAQIEGAEQVNISSVNGDVSVSEARGAVHLKHVNGDARLQGLAAEYEHHIHADGDLAIGLQPGPVSLDIRAHGAIRWDRSLGLNVQTENRRQLVASLGEGGGRITATAHGGAAVYAAGDERGRRGRGRWAVAGTPTPSIPPIPPIPPLPPVPPTPRVPSVGFAWSSQTRQKAAVSAEERGAILRMLAEGKINAEQAARLLDALGG